MNPKNRMRLRRAGFAALAFAFALGALELAAGVFVGDLPPTAPSEPGPDHVLFRGDPLLFWSLRPGERIPAEDIRINEDGRRGPSSEPQTGAARIVCLGDSVTFGFKVLEAAAYPTQLAQRLDKTHRVQVINAGVPGYSSLQGRRMLARDGAALAADIVIVSYGSNDILDAPRRDAQRPVYSPAAFWWREKMARLDLVRAVASFKPPGAQRASVRCTRDETRENLIEIAKQAKALGATALFFHPLHERPADKKMVGVGFPETLSAADVAGAFAAAEGEGWFQSDQNHPTERGYALVAETIAEALVKNGALAKFVK
jgi:lysophospholipase L1-like esterase